MALEGGEFLMAAAVEIFNKLVEDGSVVISTQTYESHERLRTRLVKLNRKHKARMEGLGFLSKEEEENGVSGKFCFQTLTSTFTLRKPKQRTDRLDFEIVSPSSNVVSLPVRKVG